jgi:ribosomal protein S18 acetylase RimI-like enzyme
VAANEVINGAGLEVVITTARGPRDLADVEALLCGNGTALTAPTPGEGARLLVARRGEQVVGAARISWGVARRAGEVRRGALTHLVVHPASRGAGVGEALARRAAVVAWWSGCHDLRVQVASCPPEAQHLLARVGFAAADDAAEGELVLRATPTAA